MIIHTKELTTCNHTDTTVIRRRDGKFVECTEVCNSCGQVVRKWIE